MADVDITSLSVEISAESQGAELNLDKLTAAISKIRTKGSIGKVCASLDTLTKSISALKSASSGMDGLSRINDFMDRISNVNLSESAKGIRSVASALTRISSVDLKGIDLSGLKGKMNSLQNGLSPLSKVDDASLRSVSSALNSIAKIPDFSSKLDSKTLDDFATSCKKITDALDPLASKIETVGNSFAKLPSNIQKVIAATDGATKASSKSAKSYLSLSNQLNGFIRNMAKLVSLKAIATYLGNAAEKFNSYYEAANLFGVSMKGLTGEASTFINKMETLLGIDPTEAMNNMATIQGLTTSFGMASDKAYVLSKNLTQLGYDLASLKNIPVAESFTKIQAAISGELEPIRRLGVDLSQARLQQELLNLGYSQSVSSLSQADKAVLRYIAIMKQTTDAQGDFARTLSSPANMIRILQAQLNSLARAVGSLLYPALKFILPPLIAAVELVKELVTGIASLMGVKVEFPDFSSASDAVGGVTDAMDNTTKATGKAAKAFKNYIMGFDELNVIQKNADSSGGSGSGAGAAGNILGDVDLSGYDMFKQYNEEFAKQIDSIKEKIRGMLPIIGAVAAALALWKLTTFIADLVDAIKKIGILKGMVAGGILIGIGFFLMFDGIKKAIEDKLNAINFAEILVGAITFVGGAALLGSKIAEFIMTSFADSSVAQAIAAAGGKMGGALIGAAVAGVVAGVAMFVTGVYDALTNGLNILNSLLIPTGSTMAGAAVGAIIGSLGGPIGTAAGALIGLLIGALTDVGIAVYQNWDKIKSTVVKKWGDFKSWWAGTVIPAIESIPAKIGNIVDSVVGWFSELPGKIGYALGYAVGTLIRWAKDLYDTVTREVPKIISNVISFFMEVPGKISSAIYGAYQSVSDWANGMIQKASEVIPEVIDSFVGFFESIPERLKALGKNIVDGLYNGVKDAMHIVADKAGELADGFVKGFKDALGIHSPSKVFYAIGEFIDKGLANGIFAAKDLAVNAIQSVSDAVKTIGSQLADENYGLRDGSISLSIDASGKSMMDTANALKRSVRTTNDSFGGWFKKMKTDLNEFTEGINAVTKAGEDISNGFKSSIDALTAASKSILNTHDGFVSAVSDIRSFVKKSVAEIENEYQYNGFFGAAGLAIQKAFEGVYLVFDKVSTAIKNVSDTIDSVKNVITTFNNLKTKVGEVIDQVPLLKQAYGSLKTFFSDLFSKDSGIGKFFSDSWDSILKSTKRFLNQLGIDFSDAWESLGIKDGVKKLTKFIFDTFDTNWGDILKSGINFLKQLGSNLGIGSGGGSSGSTSGGNSGSSGGSGANWLGALFNGGMAVVKALSGDWVGAILNALGAVGNVIKPSPGGGSSGGTSAGGSSSTGGFFSTIIDTGKKVLGDIGNWIGGAVGNVVDFFKNIFGFASGGFPDAGQLFIAREAGAEMVGSLGGHTAVANNDQIVEGIREGVEAAMERQNQLLRRQNELLQALLEKEGSAEINVSSFYQAVNRTNQRNGKTIIPVGT
nr:MAG TPA: minor tail protein [Caudoviricetes sp.]